MRGTSRAGPEGVETWEGGRGSYRQREPQGQMPWVADGVSKNTATGVAQAENT